MESKFYLVISAELILKPMINSKTHGCALSAQLFVCSHTKVARHLSSNSCIGYCIW